MKTSIEDIVALLETSANAIVRYKLRRYVLGEDPAGAGLKRLRRAIRETAIAEGLRADLDASDPHQRRGISTIYLTFRYLADIDYPSGDRTLIPFRDAVVGWLSHLETAYDDELLIREKYRVHGSFHANAIYASIVLGLANRETDRLAANLLRYQWPGGGWNCSKTPSAKGPSIVHTAYGLRGLVSYSTRRDSADVMQAVDAAAEVVLERQVYLKRSNGAPLRPVYTKPSYPYPRLYDFMAGLHILTRAARILDPRCGAALDLLETKLIPGQGIPAERKLFSHRSGRDDFTHAPWDGDKIGKANAFLTVDALEILKAAGRLD